MDIPTWMRPLKVRFRAEDAEHECVGTATRFDTVTTALALQVREDLGGGRVAQIDIAPEDLLDISFFTGNGTELAGINLPVIELFAPAGNPVRANQPAANPNNNRGQFRQGRFAYTMINGAQTTIEIVGENNGLVEVVCRSGEWRGNTVMVQNTAEFFWID